MEDKAAQAMLLAVIVALFGWITYLLRKPQDMADRKVEDVENAMMAVKKDIEQFKKEVWQELSRMKDIIICVLRGKE